MLTEIISAHLDLTSEQAQALLNLFTLNHCWQNKSLSQIKTQADFITYIQTVTQERWFKPHDASQLADTHFPENVNLEYYDLFIRLGIIKAIINNASYDYAVLLGCFETEVIDRISAFKQDVLNNLLPKQKIIFGLGSDRKLGIAFDEQTSINILKKLDLPATEINMLNLLMNETLLSPVMREHKIQHQSIFTQNKNLSPVTTAQTAISLKKFIDQQATSLHKPIHLVVYSNQPYILRQQKDIQVAMGDDYKITAVGNALSAADFNDNLKSINVCLGELARLIYTNYQLNADKIQQILLSAAEQKEISSFITGN